MSNLRTIDFRDLEDLVNFIRGPGFVLDFSDATYAEFFATELNVDIDDPIYQKIGTSKGKRLRGFLMEVDNSVALQTLEALWEHRQAYLLRNDQPDPVNNAAERYQRLVRRLKGDANNAHPTVPPKPAYDFVQIAELKEKLLNLQNLEPQKRGFAFEKFLNELFDLFGLKARQPFRNRGEQIDGSFELGAETYLLEAKWQSEPVGAAQLRAFHGALEEKAVWARGLFISHSGFSADGLHAFGRAKRVICMDGLDLYEMLQRGLPVDEVLNKKVRRAAETGYPYHSVRDLY